MPTPEYIRKYRKEKRKNLLARFLFWLHKKTEKDLFKDRNKTIFFIINNHFEDSYILQLVKIRSFEKDNRLQVHIETKRPGLLIGEGGKDINEVTSLIQEHFNIPVDIKLYEVYTPV